MRSVRAVNGSDGFGREPGDVGETGDTGQLERERGFGGKELAKLAEQLVVDLLGGGERIEERDVGRDAALRRPVVLRTPVRDQRLGLRDRDDEGGFRHSARQYAERVSTAVEPARSLQKEWWLRTLAVFQSPRGTFAALRDDSAEAAEARQEPILAIVILAGIAGILTTSLAGRLLDDPTSTA